MIYARIDNNMVAELYTPPAIFADFTIDQLFHASLQWVDITETSPQPAVGWLYDGTTFTAPPAPPAPTLAEQAFAAISNGLTIASTSTPALDGTYACDPMAQQRIMAISLYVQLNSSFPNNLATYPWMDISGTAHNFPSTAMFQTFATALADYVANLDMVIAGHSDSLPSASVTIT